MAKVLRAHQVKAIDMLRASLASGKKRPVLQASVGFGKTLVAAEIARKALERGKRVLFVVDAISLIGQSIDAFFEHDIDSLGVIQANHWLTDYSKRLQVASVQTLQRRGMPEADLVIWDECHVVYDYLTGVMAEEKWRGIPFIGLSATPWSKGMGNHFDDLVKPCSMRWLLEHDFLKPNRVYAPSHPDLSKARTVAGDYHEDDIARVMGDATLIADTVKTWKEQGEGRPTLAFCVNLDHAKAMQDAFVEAGVPWGYIDADVDADDRKAILRQMRNREICGIASVGTMTKGVDTLVGCIILARPTKSKKLLVQMLGRGMRTDDHHADCIVLDHTDSILRLGFPEDIDDSITRLCTAQKGERTNIEQERQPPKPKECKRCRAVIPQGADKCPCCGAVIRVRGEISVGDGQLSQLTGGRESSIGGGKKPELDKARFIRELAGYAALKGKQSNWLNAKYKSRTGEWPPSQYGEPITPTPQTISWLRASDIRWAKGRGAKK